MALVAAREQPEDRLVNISFKANPMQRNFILSKARADYFSARMGEGKSAALCWANFHHTKHNPGVRWAMIRDTWENLRDTTQLEFFKWFKPGVCGEYKSSTKTWSWSVGEMRGTIQWMGMDDEVDAGKLQSRELGAFGMDEPAPAAGTGGISKMIFTTAMSRLRQPGLNWYTAKLAANNPDEDHWTFRTFVEPGKDGYICWRTAAPENLEWLPPTYYEDLRETYSDRPDLVDRFVEGKFGFQRLGRPVVKNYSENIHLSAFPLKPVPGGHLMLLWDFGLTPCCLITDIYNQHWRFLDALIGDDIGTIQLIEQDVAPLLEQKYEGSTWEHVYDPTDARFEGDVQLKPSKPIRDILGGKMYKGVMAAKPAIESLDHALSQTRDGRGLIQIDKLNAGPVHRALRGGWHHREGKDGVFSLEPVKNHPHSDVGDAARYGAAKYFPIGRVRGNKQGGVRAKKESLRYFQRDNAPKRKGKLGFERPGLQIPKDAQHL